MHSTTAIEKHLYKSIAILSVAWMIMSCRNQSQSEQPVNSGAKDTVQAAGSDTLQAVSGKWADPLIMEYINKSSTFAHAADKDSLVYFFDRRENTDSAKYLVYQLGHSTENSFTTDQWLYIDSLTKAIYEYDVVDDKLVKWKK